MTDNVVSLFHKEETASDFTSIVQLGEVRGVAVEVWREIRPGGGLRIVLTPTAVGFTTVALFPGDCLPVAERCAWVVLLTAQALDATWGGFNPVSLDGLPRETK